MKPTAILAIRNEAPYLENCLAHLVENGFDFIVIDNESDDQSRDIIRSEQFAGHLLELVSHPYPGHFDWSGLMRQREAAAARAPSDWVLFVSADEIMHSFRPGESLSEAISRIAETGADVIDFNEFVFLPIDQPYRPGIGGYQPIMDYYFFEPYRPRLMRARKRDLAVSHIDKGGHTLDGEAYTLAAETLALRHYIFRDQQHAHDKYANRVFPQAELDRGWHGNRHQQAIEAFNWPARDKLKRIGFPEQRTLDDSQPMTRHYWQWTDPETES